MNRTDIITEPKTDNSVRTIENPGDFIPQKIENVLEASYSPPFYRNQLLAESMAAFHMIDTATLGIRRAYNILKAKYFPMPDYNVSSGTQVEVTIYGKTLNDSYMHILYDHLDLDLQTVFLLDRIQKGLPVEKDDVDRLRSQKLVEGRLTSLYLSASGKIFGSCYGISCRMRFQMHKKNIR